MLYYTQGLVKKKKSETYCSPGLLKKPVLNYTTLWLLLKYSFYVHFCSIQIIMPWFIFVCTFVDISNTSFLAPYHVYTWFANILRTKKKYIRSILSDACRSFAIRLKNVNSHNLLLNNARKKFIYLRKRS